MESQTGVETRARQRQRRQSKEPAAANAPLRRGNSAHCAAMESVPENGNSDILSTLSSQPSSQKAQVRNGHNETEILEKSMHQAVPLVTVEGSAARRSFQDVNIYRMCEQFLGAGLEAVRNGIEEQLAETYQQKLDDMAKDLQREKESATAANESYREIAQLLSTVQKANRDREDELSRLRIEYNKYKKQAEQRMSKTMRENNVRYEQVVAEKQQLAERYASISAVVQASASYDVGKKEEEKQLHSAAPVRLADLTKSGQRKRKEPDDDASGSVASGSGMTGTLETTASASTVATQPRGIRPLLNDLDVRPVQMIREDDDDGSSDDSDDEEDKDMIMMMMLMIMMNQ